MARYGAVMANTKVGPLMRDWRHRRHRSQLDLAGDVGVSTRHLSFVETGRSRPSPELVLAVADHLDVPLRERNVLLLAAGYAPRDLADVARRSRHGPRPRVDPTHARRARSVSRCRDRSTVERAAHQSRWAAGLLSGVSSAVLGPGPTCTAVCLHPDGLASRTQNFDEWAEYLLGQLRRSIRITGDAELTVTAGRDRRVSERRATSLDRARDPDDPPLLVPFRFLLDPDHELSLFTTLTTFGTPRDVTLDELAVELFFPADDATDRILHAASP